MVEEIVAVAMSRVLKLLTPIALACGVLCSDMAGSGAAYSQQVGAWERAIDAKGGRERLYGVRNVVISARTSGSSFETLFVLPSKFWSWHDERPTVFGRWAEMTNLERQTQQMSMDTSDTPLPLGKPTPAVIEWMRTLQLMLFLETRWQKPTLGEERHVGLFRSPVVHAAIAAEDVFDVQFDKGSGLPTKITNLDVPSWIVERELRDYRSVQGILLPHEFRGPAAALAKGATWKMTFQLNVDYNPRIFEEPPSAIAGPHAWKR
jgi:hypothetical protein